MEQQLRRQRSDIAPSEVSFEKVTSGHAVPLMQQTPESPASGLPPSSASPGATQSPVIALVKVNDADSGESNLVLNEEAVSVIRDIKGPVSVVAVAGAYRWVSCCEIEDLLTIKVAHVSKIHNLCVASDRDANRR